MDDSYSVVESIFLAALERTDDDERSAFLAQACGQNEALRRRVERLLDAHGKASRFLEQPAAQAATLEQVPRSERPGSMIGPYKLMEQIGEGGMGLVFVAEQQEPVRRRVALKVIKPGMDSGDVIARFEAERQALALMDHANIARVLDAGTTPTGRPYFVMELVKGTPITDYCDQNQLTPRQRLDLFVAVCRAVQHAHQKGIIHRDLKPSNVLVSLHDGVPVVKVIDFGIAKAVGQRLTEKTIYTAWAQLVGTPLYMSPEQAGMSALDIDTRSDIFSLGVLLYELLTGTTPFDAQRLKEAAFDEMRRIIREEEPPRPSTRLSGLGETLTSVSAKRSTEPRKLPGLVRGDLDWIVMKALDKDRSRRYETASAFAADVHRFLEERPIEARPPSSWYRFRKLARRNRGVLTAAMLVSLTLIAATAVSTWAAVRATSAEDDAQKQRKSAEDAATIAGRERQAAQTAASLAENERQRADQAKEKLRAALYDVEMSLLQPAWDADNLARFDQILERQLPEKGETDLRNFEWHYRNRLRHGNLRTVTLAGGSLMTGSPMFSADGTRVAALLTDDGRGKVHVWDTVSGKVLRNIAEEFDVERSLKPKGPALDKAFDVLSLLALSPDGTRIAVSRLVLKDPDDPGLIMGNVKLANLQDTNRHIRVWEVDSGRKLLDITVGSFPAAPHSMAFSQDGRLLAFAVLQPLQGDQLPDPPGELQVWDVGKAAAIASRPQKAFPVALTFTRDGRHLAAAEINVRPSKYGGSITSGNDADNKVQLFATDGLAEAGSIQHSKQARPKGLAAGPGDRLAVVWETAPGNLQLSVYQSRSGAYKEGRSIAGVTGAQPVFSPDGKRVTCTSAGSRVQVWDVATGEVRLQARGYEKTPAAAFSADGTRLWTAGLDGTIKEWGEPPAPPRLDGIAANSNFCPLAFALDKQPPVLARAFQDTDSGPLVVRVWDQGRGKCREPIQCNLGRPISRVQELLMSADGSRVAGTVLLLKPVASRLIVWDTISGKELFRPSDSPVYPTAMALSPDGSRIAWATEGQLTVWDLSSKAKLLEVQEPWVKFMMSPTQMLTLKFSPDGNLLACVSPGQVRLWDVTAGRALPSVQQLADSIGPVAFSADAKRLAAFVSTGSDQSEIKIWDRATGRALLSLKGEKGMEAPAFSPDGKRLATFSAGGPAGNEYRVKVLETGTGLLLLNLSTAGPGTERRLQFSADGTRLFLVNLYPQDAAKGWSQLYDGMPYGN